MSTPASGTPPRALRWAVAGSVIVMIAAGGLFNYASQLAAAKRKVHSNEITVTIHPHSCEPNALSVPAGFNSFRIVNASERAVEWEILDGVLVVEERENIAPGLSQVINATLAPGDYVISKDAFSKPEPYGIMLRKDDPQFKALVDKTLTDLMKSGEINKIYAKWFTSPIPPKNVNLNLPMNAQLQDAIKHPNDKGI